MLTTTRVSVGIAFGPAGNAGLASAVAVAFVASGDGAVGADGAGDADRFALCLFGSTVQPETRNTNNIRISRDFFID